MVNNVCKMTFVSVETFVFAVLFAVESVGVPTAASVVEARAVGLVAVEVPPDGVVAARRTPPVVRRECTGVNWNYKHTMSYLINWNYKHTMSYLINWNL